MLSLTCTILLLLAYYLKWIRFYQVWNAVSTSPRSLPKRLCCKTSAMFWKTATSTLLDRMFFTGVTPMAFNEGLSSLNMVQDISTYSSVESLFGYMKDDTGTDISNCRQQRYRYTP